MSMGLSPEPLRIEIERYKTTEILGVDYGFPVRSPYRYRDLATEHGAAAALKAESPHLALGKDPGGRQELRPYQRAARKVRMARIRRRGW